MAKKSPRLNDFRSGEMTPGLGARSDLAAYSKGCILMKNCMPLVEGGVERVPGTRFLRTVKQTEEGWSLKITKSGTGEGDVDSSPAGIDCGPTCYTFFADGASINLTAEADVGSAFEGWSGDGTGTPIRTVVMNGNKVVNAKFSSDDYLIAWYKNNEGSGLIVNNYAIDGSLGGGLLPNLDIIGDQSVFWNTLAGFGYSPFWDSGENPYAYARAAIERSIGDKYGIGVFANKMEDFSSCIFELLTTEEAGAWEILISIYSEEVAEFADNESSNVINEGSLNHWYFLFIDDTNLFKLVKDDGTLLTSSDPVLTKSLSSFIWISLGMQMNTEGTPALGFGGAIGDCIIYNNRDIPISTPGTGYKPWAQWYDELRSRYGMAARSGW